MSSFLPPQFPLRGRRHCLFLDFDGTLVDLEQTPAGVRRDESLVELLADTAGGLGGAVAIVSGRPIADIDRLLAPLRLPVAGIHGYERRAADGVLYRPTADTGRLDALRDDIAGFVAGHPGLLLEDKGVALAVHYRSSPHLAGVVTAFVAGLDAASDGDLVLMEGSAVVEIKPAVHDKATAVEAYMNERPFAGRIPVYIGDDSTDRDGFRAAGRHGGMAIAVGPRVSAQWWLSDPSAVRAWLAHFNQLVGEDAGR